MCNYFTYFLASLYIASLLGQNASLVPAGTMGGGLSGQCTSRLQAACLVSNQQHPSQPDGMNECYPSHLLFLLLKAPAFQQLTTYHLLFLPGLLLAKPSTLGPLYMATKPWGGLSGILV